MSIRKFTRNRYRTPGLAALFLPFLAFDAALAAVDRTDPAEATAAPPLATASYDRLDRGERITLGLGAPVGHVAQRDGDQLIVWFDQPRRFDLDALVDRPGSRLVGAAAPGAGPTRWLVLDVAPGSEVRSELIDGDRLVITIAGDDASKAVEASAEPAAIDAAARPEAVSSREPPSAVVSDASPSPAPGPRSLTPVAKPKAVAPPVIAAAAPPKAPAPVPAPDAASSRPAPMPGQIEVDETALDRALERTLTREGAVLLPFGLLEIEPGLSYARQEFDAPTLINLFGFPAFGETKVRRNEVTASLAARFGLPFDAQLELDLPYRYVDQSVMTTIGFDPVDETESDAWAFGDLGVGLAKTIMREGSWRPDVVARLHWDSQTGKSVDDGIALGGGSHELTGSITLVKSQDPLAFFGTVAYEKTFEEDDLDPGDRIGLSIGTVLAASPETSLRASLRQDFIGDAEFEGDQLDGTDQMAASLNVGASSVLGRGLLLDASAEIGLTEDAPDYAARVSVPIRFDLRRTFSLDGPSPADDG